MYAIKKKSPSSAFSITFLSHASGTSLKVRPIRRKPRSTLLLPQGLADFACFIAGGREQSKKKLYFKDKDKFAVNDQERNVYHVCIFSGLLDVSKVS